MPKGIRVTWSFKVAKKPRKGPFLSFPRRREFSLSDVFWAPACAGVTSCGAFRERIKVKETVEMRIAEA